MIPVLIVAYRNWEAYQRCIDSVHTSTVLAEPWTHDNSLHNIGLTKAVNKLLKIAQIMQPHRYVIWANHDVQFLPECIEKAIEFMNAHPRCAVAGMKQLDPVNPDRITHAGCDEAYPGGVHITGSVKAGDGAVSKVFPWVNMAACIIRMDAVYEIGLFDERFFLYAQDSQWCYRAWAEGWQVWYAADCEVLHDSSGCSRNPTDEQKAIVNKDMAAWAEWLIEFDMAGKIQDRIDAQSVFGNEI